MRRAATALRSSRQAGFHRRSALFRVRSRLGCALMGAALQACGAGAGAGAVRPSQGDVAGEASAEARELPQRMRLAHTDSPVFFLGPDPDAPTIGFASDALRVRVMGAPESGRVPVRADGPLRVSAYVPEELLVLRVQRRGQVRGTPVYLAPNQAVRVLGASETPERWRVLVAPVLMGETLAPVEGTYPIRGLGADDAPTAAEPPAEGVLERVPAQTELRLWDRPAGSVRFVIPARQAPWCVRTLGKRGAFTAVRAGEGPYLVGYTDQALLSCADGAAPDPARSAPQAPAQGSLPVRLLRETGPLRRVKRGAVLRFNGTEVATFEEPGYARVLARYPNGELDVFAAVDDTVALRGLLRQEDVTDLALR